MILVFFVEKTDGKTDGKKCMVQNYYYLNEGMIRNTYPLPLISDIVKNIGIKKVFMKIDLQWRYNNVWIKEEDEWKVAFTMLEELFELMIMFFGFTNFPTTFQTIINEILRDLINTGKVVSFINNIIVGIEEEEEHDEIVEEVIKRLA